MKILVVCGGDSSEREVSIVTGKSVFEALKPNFKYVDCLICESAYDCINKIIYKRPDIVFIALHGGFGENGQLQATLETLNIKHTGCGFSESNIAMNKFATKSILKSKDIPTAEFILVKTVKDLEKLNFLPVCIKPNREGSSVGVSFAFSLNEVRQKTEKLLDKYQELIIERKLSGKELTVGVLFGEALPIIHIRPKQGFYDYKNKYTHGATDYIVPAVLDKKITELVQQVAVEAFYAIGCTNYARIDLILEGNIPYVLEINTIPGMTPTSLLPKAAKAKGISFEELVKLLINKTC